MWAPDVRLILELGLDRFEVTGRGSASGIGPFLVRLVDADSCRVLARFEAEAGLAYVIKLGDVPAPTVLTDPVEQAGDPGLAFERSEFSGCDGSRDVEIGSVAAVAVGIALLAVLAAVPLALLRARHGGSASWRTKPPNQ